MDGTKIVAAWEEWLASEEGRKASNTDAASHLENLQSAFYAGMRAGGTAVADEVIAAMGKEKSS
jgi:hypothetical protein